MGIFGGKKKKKKQLPQDDKQKYVDYIKSYKDINIPKDVKKRLYSREYRIYKETEKSKTTWYEFLAKIASGLIKINPDKDTSTKLERDLDFIGYSLKPVDVFSLFIVTVIFFPFLAALLVIINLMLYGEVSLIMALLVSMLGVPIGYYLLKFPENQVKVLRINASSEVVLCILYMVVSMRVSPNLENAIRFAASNISGALAWDLRRMLWDIQMRNYMSADDALTDYIAKWKSENEEFADALRFIKDSTTQTQQRSKEILDEALSVVLDGTKTRMKHYAQDLNMPVMIIHMMGIVLPVLGTIMAPLAAVFLSDLVRPEHFIIGYNIVLPLIIIWFINNILKKRPVTISQIDTSGHPGIAPKGTFFLSKGKPFPALPIAIFVFAIFVTLPLIFFVQNPDALLSAVGAGEDPMPLIYSLLIIVGIAFGLGTYFFLTSFQNMKIQKEIETIESEFEFALFQLGNRISSGTPTEVAIERSLDDIKDMKIANLFRLTLRNIKTLGMTFEEALFNKRYGALIYYPSQLIRNIMFAVVDTAKKGVRYASEGMLRIASYMKNIRETQEYIRDLLSETVGSMKFQAYLLTPLITGLIVSMSEVIMKVLSSLSGYLEGLEFEETMGMTDLSTAFGNMETAIAPSFFQLIVGFYMIEVIIILAMFLTKINYGDNKTIQYYQMAIMLFVAVTIYFIVAFSASTIFGEMIDDALRNFGMT